MEMMRTPASRKSSSSTKPLPFLLENLEGGIAWKDPEQAVRQKERLRAMKEKKELEIGHAQQADSMEEEVPEDAQGMNMTM